MAGQESFCQIIFRTTFKFFQNVTFHFSYLTTKFSVLGNSASSSNYLSSFLIVIKGHFFNLWLKEHKIVSCNPCCIIHGLFRGEWFLSGFTGKPC